MTEKKKPIKIEGKWTATFKPEIRIEADAPESVKITNLCPVCHRIHDLTVPCFLVR